MNPLFMSFGSCMSLMSKRWLRTCPKPVLTGCVALLALAFSAQAKSAEDYFRSASYQYVSGKIQEASVEAEEGLRAHPDDARLQMLAEHLRKMKDEQSGRSGQNKQKGDGKQEPPQGDERNQDPQKNESGNDKGDQQSDRRSPDERPDEDRDADGRGEGERPRPQAMTEEEAKRLLNSFADDEKKEQAERRKVLRSRVGTEQDW